MPVKKNFLSELYSCFYCPFRNRCRDLWTESTGQAGNYTFKEVGQDCPEGFEKSFEYSNVEFSDLGNGARILPRRDKENIENDRPSYKFWKELNLHSVYITYTDDGGYDSYGSWIFFDTKEQLISWLLNEEK